MARALEACADAAEDAHDSTTAEEISKLNKELLSVQKQE